MIAREWDPCTIRPAGLSNAGRGLIVSAPGYDTVGIRQLSRFERHGVGAPPALERSQWLAV